MSIAELQAVIAKLPRAELDELIAWLQRYAEDSWDKQIEEDLAAGRLDPLLHEVEREYAAGLARPIASLYREFEHEDRLLAEEG